MSIKMVTEKSFNLGSLRLAENQIFFISNPILAKRLQTKKLAHFYQEVSAKKKPGPSENKVGPKENKQIGPKENKQIGPKENKGTGYVRNKTSQAAPLFDDQFLNIGDFEEKVEGLKEEEKEEEFEEFEEEEVEEEELEEE